ncbi:MAG: hypothetical protein IPM20_06480 [Gammaproteobacteria bacterium]|nr:hypothetical protein [Gammaproteobacteria bacterium]
MSEWISCEDGFIAADVIRWKECIWEKRRSRSNRARRFGERLVEAEVLQEAEADEWVRLLVVGSTVLSEFPTRTPKKLLLDKGQEIRRKRQTIMRSKPERLLWSDERARQLVVSKFLGNRS